MARYFVHARKNPDATPTAKFGPFKTKKEAQAVMNAPNVQSTVAPGSVLTLDSESSMARPGLSRLRGPRRAAVTSNPAGRRRTVTRAPVDHTAAHELKLFIDNDGALYRQMYLPIVKNLQTKMKRGKFDAAKVAKAFLYLADEGARRYTKAFDGRAGFGAFNKPTREFVAAEFASEFIAEPYAHGTLTNPSAAAHRRSAAKMTRAVGKAKDPFDKAFFRGALAAHKGSARANPSRMTMADVKRKSAATGSPYFSRQSSKFFGGDKFWGPYVGPGGVYFVQKNRAGISIKRQGPDGDIHTAGYANNVEDARDQAKSLARGR